MILDPLTPDSPTLYFCLTYTGPASTALRVRQPHPPLPPLNEGRPVGTHYPGRWCSSQGFTREQAVSCVFGDLDDLGEVAVAIPGVRQRSRVQIVRQSTFQFVLRHGTLWERWEAC